MAWASLLLALVAHCTGATSQSVIQQSALITNPGGTVILTCGASTGAAVSTGNYASWIQQKPYQVPKGIIGGTTNRVPGVPVRFSGALAGGKATLTITGAQPEDEAEYYCALWFSNHCTVTDAGGEVRHKPRAPCPLRLQTSFLCVCKAEPQA